MVLSSRFYTELSDLDRMKALVTEFRQILPDGGVVHIGDLDWWTYYNTSGEPLEQKIRLWEDASGKLLAWSFTLLKYCDCDLTIHPKLRGTDDERAIVAECDRFTTELALKQLPSDERAARQFSYGDDTARIQQLQGLGYVEQQYIVYFEQPITGEIPTPQLPEGFTFLPAMRLEFADHRADVHANSFNPSKMTGDYYRHFMTAPGYDPELDTVVVAPDGHFASSVMGWIDPVTKIGTFEPVGTRTEFQRMGLGRAALYEGMRRLKARGMEVSTVGCSAAKEGNLAFYRSAGYEIKHHLRSYTKNV